MLFYLAAEKKSESMFEEVKIGEQTWMRLDLRVTHFRNGEPIHLVIDDEDWVDMTSAAYCITPEGNFLYNWYAVNDERGLAPDGWHVPTDDEWTALTDTLGGEEVAGSEMKSTAWDGTNSSGFSALPAGYRDGHDGYFGNAGFGGWWSSSADGADFAWYRDLDSVDANVYRSSNFVLRFGFSVRCLKD